MILYPCIQRIDSGTMLNILPAHAFCVNTQKVGSKTQSGVVTFHAQAFYRVRNLKFATYLKFATCENTNKINELW